ncbi:MAG TPA: aspartate/glutamate racemase family protein [Thermoanaerobaculia bacterium]
MKTLGLLGGMSWESTVLYYRIINQTVSRELGGFHSAKILMVSVDFHEIEILQREGDWDRAGALLADAARRLETAGADLLVICTNTMHLVVPAIERAVGIPLLHIADATADAIQQAGLRTVGLLGTRFTMEQPFYRERLEARGLKVVVPEAEDRETVHRVIYDELCRGEIHGASRSAYEEIMRRLVERGAEGIILGCTEIGLLVGPENASVPLFDTTEIHARAAALRALADLRS